MKKAFLTGATGFVGANLARRLLSDGHEVHLLLRPGYQSWRLDEIQEHVQLHEVSLSQERELASLVGSIRPDWIFHLAAHGAYSMQTDLAEIIATNFNGTVNLVQAALVAGFEAFVNTGSSSEYGFKDHAPSENEWLEPNSHYAVTKAAATLFCRYTAQAKNVRLTTLRLYSVYGPFEEPTRLIPALLVRGLAGELPPLADPRIARDYVFADDVSEAYLLAAQMPATEPGAVYNVGTGVQTSLGEVVEETRRLLQIAVEPEWGSMPARIWDTSVWVADHTRIREQLGWTPRHSLADGLARTIEWFQQNPSLLEYYRQRIFKR